jgi:hypothetical protein
MKKRSVKVGSINYKKKDISNSLITDIKKFQRSLQIEENIRYGRKAKYISFVYATKKKKDLAKFILGDRK